MAIVRRALVAGLVGLAAVVLFPTTADAHALIATSTPADGTRLDEAPKEITASFTEPPELSLSELIVLDQSGGQVQEGETQLVAGDASSLRVSVGDLEQGVYTVTWRVVSKVDGHLTGGAFAFGVQADPSAVNLPEQDVPEAPAVSPLEMGGRWIFFVGFSALLGASWIALLAFPEPPRGVMRLALASAAVGVIGLVILGWAQQRAAGVPLGELLATTIGRALVWRAIGAGVALAAGFLAVFAPLLATRRAALVLAGLASGGVMLVHVMAGHAASPGSWGVVAIVSQWAHFAAVGVWIGGLAALLVGVRGREDELKGTAVRRFSAVAGVALGVVAVTGVVLAIDEVGGWGALISNGYGRLVLVKTALLLALAGLGALNRWRNVPAAIRSLRGLRRTSWAELGIAGVTLVAAAALATLVPPQLVPAEAETPPAILAEGSDFGTTVRARLEVDPGVPGPNRFELFLEDYDTGEPVEADRVALRFDYTGALEVPQTTLDLATTEEDGEYTADGTNLSVGGIWDVTAVVQSETASVEVPLEIPTVCNALRIPGKGRRPAVNVVESSGGTSVEGYVEIDPIGTPEDEVHFTFVGKDGKELELDEPPVVLAAPRGSAFQPLTPVLPITQGHFVIMRPLDPGYWRFYATATAPFGAVAGCFEQRV